MEIYRHYKKKYYRVYQTARHSEDLSELVFYECLYPNPLGQYWVRPKDNFEDSIEAPETKGQKSRRFEKVSARIESKTLIDTNTLDRLQPLIESSLSPYPTDALMAKLEQHPLRHLLLEAYWEDKLVGFKLGFAHDSSKFYSWLGAVCKEYRGFGIGTELMRYQHQWAHRQGFQFIETKTDNHFIEMLKLNLNHGFKVIGTEQRSRSKSPLDHNEKDHPSLRLVLQKDLTSETNQNDL